MTDTIGKQPVIVFPNMEVDPWHTLPQFTIMGQDLKPIYAKQPIRGFEDCSSKI